MTGNEDMEAARRMAADAEQLYQQHLLLDEHGGPLGFVTPGSVIDLGTTFAFAMAGAESEEDRLTIQRATLEAHGPEMYGYICANALAVMARDIIAPTFQITEAYGHNLRKAMRNIAEGKDPDAE